MMRFALVVAALLAVQAAPSLAKADSASCRFLFASRDVGAWSEDLYQDSIDLIKEMDTLPYLDNQYILKSNATEARQKRMADLRIQARINDLIAGVRLATETAILKGELEGDVEARLRYTYQSVRDQVELMHKGLFKARGLTVPEVDLNALYDFYLSGQKEEHRSAFKNSSYDTRALMARVGGLKQTALDLERIMKPLPDLDQNHFWAKTIEAARKKRLADLRIQAKVDALLKDIRQTSEAAAADGQLNGEVKQGLIRAYYTIRNIVETPYFSAQGIRLRDVDHRVLVQLLLN